MKITALAAACLLAAAFSAQAAQKSPKKPATTPAQTAPQDIDVDALARAKDAGANTGEPAKDGDANSANAAAASDTAAPAQTPDVPAGATTEIPSRPAPLAPPSQAEKSLAAGCESRATALLDAAQKGDFAAASRDFDANMRSKLKPEQFKKAWDSLAQFGALQARGQSHAAEADGYIAITVPLLFEKKNLYAQVACGSDGRVAGFYVKPLETPAQ